ncbi:desmoplakin isoform X2 [Notolabrus celidotus]|uniref:desmoplakin isoform X2 n=1 Tax=Notolabrus celidotus TaxID=1203425 RepID=UPI0014905FCF|nr:desmoplakin isoform X2 [Notolabrus celidotus]
MSLYGSQRALDRTGSRGDLTGGMTQQYARSEVIRGSGNGYEPYLEGYNSYTFSKSSMGGMGGGMMGGGGGGGGAGGMVMSSSGGGGGMMMGGGGGSGMMMGGGGGSGMMMGGGGGGGGGMLMSGGGGGGGGMMMSSGGGGGGMISSQMSSSNLGSIHQRAMILQGQCQDYLKRADHALQGGNSGEAERYMVMAKETIEQLKSCAMDLRQMGQPNETVIRTVEFCRDQLKGVHMAISGTLTRRRSTRGSSGGWEEPPRSFQDAMGWIGQQKRLIETASWGDDPAAIDQQLISHQRFHSSIQRSSEMDRARDELRKKGDKGNLHALEQEWDSLQKLSFGRTQQLQDLQKIIQEMSREIMWVNDTEEEELVFDWGDKNIDQYIPKKQESYSKLMSNLEEKEKDLNKLKGKVDTLLKNNHPAADKIEAYKDTLQTQWSWLLQITKCIDTHLKENSAYSQFFKEANETYSALQKEHETVRKNFVCDKNTSLEDLLGLLRGLEREKEKIMENKRQVQHLVNRSKNIVRLKPRNPEEKSSSPVMVKALCDFKQDQKIICKNDEAILRDNSQRSKWNVTGPGGLEMDIPSVCLIVPPPNPISVSLANKNEQYYEAILSIWNQLYINVKSLVAWQYCVLDIKHINSLTISMLAKMRPEEYRQIIKNLETHFDEFKVSCVGSQMFADEDKRTIESQFSGAQDHYETLVVQLPTYIVQGEIEVQQAAELQHQQGLILLQQQQQAAAEAEARRLEEEARRLEEERRRAELRRQEEKRAEAARREAAKKEACRRDQEIKKETLKLSKAESARKKAAVSSSHSLTELHALRLRLDGAEDTLGQHIHICLGDDGVHDCGLKISQLEIVQGDVDSMRAEFLRLRDRIMKELEGMCDSDKAQFLRSEVGIINQRLGSLESSSSAYLQRLRALRDMLESVARAEDIVKVYEARLTEKETTSLTPGEVEEYVLALKKMKLDLDQKKDVLASMESELAKASHWNGQVSAPYHRCDMMLSKYTEQVNLLSDRWRRILGQIDTRVQDLQTYQPQLQNYKQTSTSLSDWIDATRRKQDILQSTKIESIQALQDQINNTKALNGEIKTKRGTVDSVLKDNDACVISIKDYETDLNSYTSGLETLLNIPIKRTMLKSPSMDLNLEATQLQTRYMELLTQSGDYYKFLGELLKNMEELKIRNTRIDLLEEELRQLRDDIQDRNAKNKSLEDSVSRIQLELSNSKDQLLSMEVVKQSTALQVNATKESLDSTQGRLADLNEQVARLTYLLEEEKRKKRLAEERYTQQQEEYESVLRRRQKELETVSWSKVELEKSVASKEQEIDQLRRQLADEAARVKELQKEISKITATMQSIQSKYNDIVSERDDLLRRLQMSETDKDRLKRLEDELNRLKLTLESELRNKQRLQEESDRLKKDVTHWKDQYESKQDLIKQYDADKDRLERDKNSLKSEIDRLMRELRELEDTYKSKLSAIQKELRDMTALRQNMEAELRKAKETPALDASSVIFDGVRKKVTADQLLDCGVLDKPTFSQLAKGHKTVPEVSADKKINLKGTGPIAGVVVEGQKGSGSANGLLFKMTFAEAKKDNLLPPDSVDLLLDAQAATGHIIDPRTNQKYTVAEACDQGVVDEKDRGRLLAAEAAAVGFSGPTTSKPLSAYEAMKTGLIDKNTTLRLLQAQESTGGILDPALSVFLPKDIAIERNLIDDNIYRALNQRPELYLDPESEEGVTYMSMKRRCKVELNTGLLLLPVPEKMDTSKLVFEGVRKPVTAKQLVDCGVLDKPTLKDLEKGKKSVPDVSLDKKVYLKGTGSIAGVAAGPAGKMSFTEAKKQKLMPADIADLLLDAQAATGHIIDPTTNEKLTVDEACARGVVDRTDLDRLLAAEAAAVGYRHPGSAKPLSVFEAMKKGLVDQKTGLRLLQAQESAGGILDPNLSVFLPKETAIGRNILDDDLSRALNKKPECYLDPDTQDATSYVSLKKKCKVDPRTGLLLLPEPKKPVTVQGLRDQVSVMDLVDANLLKRSDMDQLRTGRLTSQDIEKRLSPYLRGSTCIAGIYEEVEEKVLPIYEAMKEGLLRPGTTLELLEAQAASGFIVDPVNNHYLSVDDAYSKRLFGPEYKDNLLSAERAVTGYKLPGTDKTISLFQAIERGLVEKGHGIRLLEAQIASGGIIDPEHSHRIDVDVAYKKGYFDEKMNRILSNPTAETKGFFDPNTEDNLTYMELKKRCITDKKTGLILLPVTDKSKLESTLKNTLRRRRVIIVDPETNREMTVREAYDKGLIDYDTFIELSEQECEWEEITITAPDGSISFKIVDKKTGREYDITEMLENGLISQSDLDKYKSRAITITQFADILTNQTKQGSSSTSRSSAATGKSSVTSTSSSSSRTSASPASSSVTFSSSSSSRTSAAPSASSLTSTSTSSTLKASGTSGPSSMTSSSVRSRPLSPTLAKMTTTKTTTYTERSSTTERNSFSERSSTGSSLSSDPVRNISSVSISLGSPIVTIGEQEPVGAIFDTETLEKISITEALDRGLVDTITAQRLLEAQACTGGIVNPANGRRLGIQEASRLGIIDEDMAPKLKPAQKAFMGFEDLKTKRKMSAAEAMKEKWLPYEAGQRFLEFQFITGGFQDPEKGCRRTIQDALSMGWLEERSAQKLQDPKSHTKNLTCPKTKLKISYKDALDNCLSEESTGVRMLPASSMSSSGISSPYNMSSAPGSTTGSRSGSRRGSRRGSLDLGSPVTSSSRYTFTSISSSTK